MSTQLSLVASNAADYAEPISPSAVVKQIQSRLQANNIVSFSGGKDSSVVLSLVLAACRRSPTSKLYIVTADTGMEIPYFQEYVVATQEKIRSYIDAERINAEIVTVKPPPKDSFWCAVLGKGYPAAHMGFRWCTGKLKIDPISRFTKGVVGTGGMTFVGVRSAESELRARIYQQKDYKPHHFAPILDWSAADVWEYLMTEPCPWGDYAKLIEVYKYSSDECVYGEKSGVCVGNARYGCWACPLQKASQLDMLAYHTGDDRYLQLKSYKQTLVGMANRKSLRSRIRRNLSAGTGPFLLPIRKRLFADLRALEERTGWQLLSTEDERLIREDWQKDEHIHNHADASQPMLWDLCKEERGNK